MFKVYIDLIQSLNMIFLWWSTLFPISIFNWIVQVMCICSIRGWACLSIWVIQLLLPSYRVFKCQLLWRHHRNNNTDSKRFKYVSISRPQGKWCQLHIVYNNCVFLEHEYLVALCHHCESRWLLDINIVSSIFIALYTMFSDAELPPVEVLRRQWLK